MLLDNLKVHVSGVEEDGVNVRMTLVLLEAQPATSTPAATTTPAKAPAHPALVNPFPGFKVVNKTRLTVDAATAAGIQRGQEFTLTAK